MINCRAQQKETLYKLIFFTLFLYAIALFNQSSLMLIVLIIAAFMFAISKNIKFRVDLTWGSLIFFSISFFTTYTFLYGDVLKPVLYYLVGPIGGLMVGYVICKRYIQSRGVQMTKIIVFLGCGMFLHAMLNMIMRFLNLGMNASTRITYDFWRNEPIAVTGQGLLLAMVAAIAPQMIPNPDSTKWQKVFWSVPLVLAIVFTFQLANRTFLMILTIIVFLDLILLTKRKGCKIPLAIILISALLLIILENNLFGIADYVNQTPLVLRFKNTDVSAVSTSRTNIWKSFFNGWFDYPLGGKKIILYGNQEYVHNVWMDIYYLCGAIPFVFFCIYTYSIINDLHTFCTSISCSYYNRILLLNTYIAFLISFAVEPVLQGNPYFFTAFIIINGAVNASKHGRVEGDATLVRK